MLLPEAFLRSWLALHRRAWIFCLMALCFCFAYRLCFGFLRYRGGRVGSARSKAVEVEGASISTRFLVPDFILTDLALEFLKRADRLTFEILALFFASLGALGDRVRESTTFFAVRIEIPACLVSCLAVQRFKSICNLLLLVILARSHQG